MASRLVRAPLWIFLFLLVTIVLRIFRDDLARAHSVLIYLLVILGASASSGRRLGFAMAIASSFTLDYFFFKPYDRFGYNKPVDVLILVAFLTVALVTTQLLARARSESEKANARAIQLEELAGVKESARLKDIFLASVSHDLRTPLTAMRALAQNISSGRGDAPAQATLIVEQSDRLSSIVGNLLDLSRLRAGAFPISREANTGEDLLGATVRQFSGTPNAGRIKTETDFSAPVLVGEFDFVQSLRILCNLVDNALRYSPAGTPVTIGLSSSGSQLEFRVTDEGPGISASDSERMFEPFYRPGGSTPDSGSVGLGLAIAKELAGAQNGSVRYEPRSSGGSVFTLTLPLRG
jgi:two-component system sensor histidine kinase KdpD